MGWASLGRGWIGAGLAMVAAEAHFGRYFFVVCTNHVDLAGWHEPAVR
jgi:hypothetical protein